MYGVRNGERIYRISGMMIPLPTATWYADEALPGLTGSSLHVPTPRAVLAPKGP
jgi:hypothetical protein